MSQIDWSVYKNSSYADVTFLGVYRLHDLKTLKPIKPTLTEKEREVLLKFSSETDNLQVVAEVESYLRKNYVPHY